MNITLETKTINIYHLELTETEMAILRRVARRIGGPTRGPRKVFDDLLALTDEAKLNEDELCIIHGDIFLYNQ